MGSASRPGRSLPPGKIRYPLYRWLGGPQCRSGQVEKISPPAIFEPQTVQPVASRYTDYATGPTNYKFTNFDVLLTVHLSIFISVFNQLDAQNLFHNKFYFMPLHASSTCAHHQEVKIALHSLWYHHTYKCDEHMSSKHVEA